MSQPDDSLLPVTVVVADHFWSSHEYRFDFSDWKFHDRPQPGTVRFARSFQIGVSDADLFKALQELQHLLVALFVTDSAPRKILYCDYHMPSDEEGLRTQLGIHRVFGPPRQPDETDVPTAIHSFRRTGMPHHANSSEAPRVPDATEVQHWYDFLVRNPDISSSLVLIQEAFGMAHVLQHDSHAVRLPELASVVLLLVSGLENLFRRNEDSHADIGFKFKTVGCAYYTRFAAPDALEDLVGRSEKFTVPEFKSLLGILYDIRSSFAHGELHEGFYKPRNLRKLNRFLALLNVEQVPPEMPTLLFPNLVGAVWLLEPHILALIRGADHHLTRGVEVLDDILQGSGGP